ncbi:hypothetical protein K438DRAFT_1755176 [Mycena galopus ATCC 62051]|nr:hypothetical protein K438DRAFT_1755176 [Mycena galopus ATCC 62051]
MSFDRLNLGAPFHLPMFSNLKPFAAIALASGGTHFTPSISLSHPPNFQRWRINPITQPDAPTDPESGCRPLPSTNNNTEFLRKLKNYEKERTDGTQCGARCLHEWHNFDWMLLGRQRTEDRDKAVAYFLGNSGHPTTAKKVTGPPQALISRIEHLHDLLRNLPSSLPNNPPQSLYNFSLDPEILKDGGHFSAVGHALEVSFETHLLRLQGRTIMFVERGARLDTLVKLLKTGVKHMSPGERNSFQEAWLEQRITAAVDSGARTHGKKRKAVSEAPATADCPPVAKKSKPTTVITIDDDSESEDSPSITRTLPPFATSSTSSHSSVSRQQVIGNPKQLTLGFLGWQKAKPGEIAVYWAKAKEAGSERREKVLITQKEKAESKKERERDLARLRQQRRRAKLKQEKVDEEPEVDSQYNARTVLMQGADAVAHGNTAIPDIASLSRPATQGWKNHRNGTQGGAVQGKAQRVFWFDPFLWAIIEPTIRRCGWSAADTIKELHRAHPLLFNGSNNKLHHATLWKWIVKGEKRFTDAALRSIATRRSLAGSGCTGILTPYPAVVEEIVTTLKGLRVSGCAVNVHIARMLNWATFKATQAAKKIPDNAPELCERTFFRLAHPLEDQDIPAKTRKALRKYLENNTILAEEIKARLGSRAQPLPPSDIGINDGTDITDGDGIPEDEQDEEADGIEDNTGVPLPVVVDRVLRVRVQDNTGCWVAKVGIHADGEARFSAGDAEEDIWAYNPQGELWTKGGIPADESGSEDEGTGSGDNYDDTCDD